MDKKSKLFVFIIVVLIGIIAGALYLNYGNDKSEEVNSTSINEVNNNISNNVVNEDNKVENVISENVIQNSVNEVNTNTTENNVSSNNTEVVSINGEEKAISIAKDAWGETEGYYFTKEGPVNANGEYVIAVTSNAKVYARYTVNPNTGKYTVEYE